MKIALVTPEAHWHGGVPQYVSALAKALTTEHEVTIFSVVFNDLENTGIHHHPVWALGSDGFIRSLTFAVASSLLLLLSHLKKERKGLTLYTHMAITPHWPTSSPHTIAKPWNVNGCADKSKMSRLGRSLSVGV